MRLAWATDIHLNHATNTVQHKFYQAIKDQAGRDRHLGAFCGLPWLRMTVKVVSRLTVLPPRLRFL